MGSRPSASHVALKILTSPSVVQTPLFPLPQSQQHQRQQLQQPQHLLPPLPVPQQQLKPQQQPQQRRRQQPQQPQPRPQQQQLQQYLAGWCHQSQTLLLRTQSVCYPLVELPLGRR